MKLQTADELITFLLAPMQMKLDRLTAANEHRAIKQAQYEADLKAGVCVAGYGLGCACMECESHNMAYEAIDAKPTDLTAHQALIQAGFTDVEARHQLEIFDDLGIFDDLK